MEKVIVAMSGGVDSSYAAWLLRQQGYVVEGVCLDLFDGSKAPEEALAIGERLGIHVHVLDWKQRFREEIVDYFCRSYHGGVTPNPCAACNPLIKFRSLLEAASKFGAEKIATGHYTRCVWDNDSGVYSLYKGLDSRKDQSYFLYRLSQNALRKVIFPLGEYTKSDVRAAAVRENLPVAARDSQEICFIPDGNYIRFLQAYASETGMAEGLQTGDFVDEQGCVLGRHQGVACYTIGQRKNLGVSFGNRMFVLAVDPKANQVVLGQNEALFTRDVKTALNVFTAGIPSEQPFTVEVKLRSGATPAKAVYHPMGEGRGKLIFEATQRAATPGQCAVYYKGERLLGGGIIV